MARQVPPQRSRSREIERRGLEADWASLEEELAIVHAQMRRERDDRDRLLLQRDADNLLERIKDIEGRLDRLDSI